MPINTEKARKDSFFNLYFTSTISIAVALFMLGLVAMLLLWGNHVTRFAKENLVVSLILSDATTDDDLTRIEKYLASADFVKHYQYISKDAALEEHIADVGDNPVELLGYNPIKASIEVNLKAEFISEAFLQKLSKDIEIYPFVENVAYQQIMIPTIKDMVVIQFIMQAGNIMSIGFEKAYALQTDMNLQSSEIIATYVYKKGLLDGDYSFSTAVGLFNTVINVILLVAINKIVAKMNDGKGI